MEVTWSVFQEASHYIHDIQVDTKSVKVILATVINKNALREFLAAS